MVGLLMMMVVMMVGCEGGNDPPPYTGDRFNGNWVGGIVDSANPGSTLAAVQFGVNYNSINNGHKDTPYGRFDIDSGGITEAGISMVFSGGCRFDTSSAPTISPDGNTVSGTGTYTPFNGTPVTVNYSFTRQPNP
jgi:hypothetical protein